VGPHASRSPGSSPCRAHASKRSSGGIPGSAARWQASNGACTCSELGARSASCTWPDCSGSSRAPLAAPPFDGGLRRRRVRFERPRHSRGGRRSCRRHPFR
jgi:hypothetical protein